MATSRYAAHRRAPQLTSRRSTYSPKLLELERTIEPLLPTEGEPLKSDTIPAAAGDVSIGDDGSSIASTASKVSRQAPSDVDDTSNSTQVGKSESQASDAKVAPQTELKNLLVAYFYISDLASRLNMPNLTGVTKHALSLCASAYWACALADPLQVPALQRAVQHAQQTRRVDGHRGARHGVATVQLASYDTGGGEGVQCEDEGNRTVPQADDRVAEGQPCTRTNP